MTERKYPERGTPRTQEQKDLAKASRKPRTYKGDLERRQRPPKAPGPRYEFLQRLALQAAGFKEQDLRKAMDRTREALDATVVKTASFEGKITDVKHFTDHQTRLMAAREIFGMVPGMKADEEKGSAPITLQLLVVNGDGSQTAVEVSSGTAMNIKELVVGTDDGSR